ncbi:hypothetical protein QR680_010125 [Steinernema hermaphroditum]|uniref:glutathione transferase n=1 Tax=Steinernema hermaphroditum TaxID=289476 RepID=A0AA39MA40_9BILA|nr:hypothetical protein QR680_010125 [Steinernema hermaphroditum]
MVYKLHYFEGLGARVEPARILLAYGKIPYEMVEIPFEKWPEVKSKYPNEKIPVLELDGKFVPQSIAIMRYFARKLHLLGKDDWEMAQADAFVYTIEDTITALMPDMLIRKIATGQKGEYEKEAAEKLRPFLERLEKHLKTTNGENLVGNHLTWADLCVADCWKRYGVVVPNLLDDFPAVRRFSDAVYALPGVKEYVAKRNLKTF